MKRIFLSPNMSTHQSLYGYGNAGQAASQAWCGMGGQGFGFGVQGVRGSNPAGYLPFLEVSLQNLETLHSFRVNVI